MKHCTACGKDKPRSAFGLKTRYKDGLNPRCRECCNAQARADYHRNYGKTQEVP